MVRFDGQAVGGGDRVVVTMAPSAAATRPLPRADEPSPDRIPEQQPARRRGQFEAVVLAAGGLVAAWLLVRQIRRVDLGSLLAQLSPGWAGLVVLLVGASFVGAAWNLMGFSAVPLRAGPTVLAQVAGGFVKVVSPAAVGAALVNARYLRRAGASRTETVTSIGSAQLVQFLVTVGVLGALATLPDSPVSRLQLDPVLGLVAAALAAVVVLAGWAGRRHPRVRPVLARVRAGLGAVADHAAREPGRVALGLLGSLVLLLAFALGLASSVRAFGGSIDLLTLVVVFLAGSAAGSLVPSPGGLGTVEAALVTGLVTTGLAPEVAVPAVLWFRLVSVWVPVPLGWLAVHALRRRALL